MNNKTLKTWSRVSSILMFLLIIWFGIIDGIISFILIGICWGLLTFPIHYIAWSKNGSM